MKSSDMRFRGEYGGPESNAQLRYVEVYSVEEPEEYEGELTTRTNASEGVVTITGEHEIYPGAVVDVEWSDGERTDVIVDDVDDDEVTISGGEGDDLPSASTEVTILFYPDYQPVKCKFLRLADYQPASTGVVEATNAEFTINTVKSGEFHGSHGNGIELEFDIDGGIAPADAEAEITDRVLTIKVRNSSRTWASIQAAVNALAGFTMEVDLPAEEFTSGDESLTATFEGGANGKYQPAGAEFGIGDRRLEAEVGDRVWVVWSKSALRWEVVGGGNSTVAGGVVRGIGVATTEITAATEDGDDRDPGFGTVELKVGRMISSTWYNRSYQSIPIGSELQAIEIDGKMWIQVDYC